MSKKPTHEEAVKLNALLGKAKRLSERRNDYYHAAWSVSEAGQPIIKLEDHSWGPAPSKEEVERVASDILALGIELNTERLHGFINSVAIRAASAPSQ